MNTFKSDYMTKLSDDQIRLLIEACADPLNEQTQQILAYANVRTATGLVGRLMLSSGEERDALEKIVKKLIDRPAS